VIKFQWVKFIDFWIRYRINSRWNVNNERRKNYNADITYVTNYEVTFDFLRDNMALNLSDVVLRPFNYCIIDEVDSILIDEAQTPLIISNNIQTPIEKYIVAAEITDYLELKYSL
jgi:preprotein translocase subunit SecA